MIKKAISIIVLLFFSTLVLWGHGIKVTLEKKHPFVLVNAGYHGSKALANASVTISFAEAPGEKETSQPGTGTVTTVTEFQKGNTDKNGNFCFYPDKPGKWDVLVDDLTGHRGKKSIILSEDFFNVASLPEKEKSPLEITPVKVQEKSPSPIFSEELCYFLLKIVLGVLLILVITYIFYRIRKRRERSEE